MYVTRPLSLSLYLTNLGALSLAPPEGPNGGYLVLQDDASTQRHFFGLFKDSNIRGFPFPQNKLHTVTYVTGRGSTNGSGVGGGPGQAAGGSLSYPVYFIPVINQPLSSNTYYAIKLKGSHKGEACASSTDEDMTPCCFWNCVNDVKPRPLHPTDIYQQFKVSIYKRWHMSGFFATSVASDGHPPSFLRWKGWILDSKTPKNFSLGEAEGLNSGLRARLPAFNFPISYKASSPVVVGKWYCPFMFVKDNLTPKEQVKKSMFYEMTLEQQWERIFLYGDGASDSSQGKKTVFVDVTVPTESITVGKTDATQDHQDDKLAWFNTIDGRTRVGLSSLVVKRMIWEQERAGWVPKDKKQDKVSKTEEFEGVGKWGSYGCYMLVERFVLKRLDGTIVLTYSFSHTHQTRSKWD